MKTYKIIIEFKKHNHDSDHMTSTLLDEFTKEYTVKSWDEIKQILESMDDPILPKDLLEDVNFKWDQEMNRIEFENNPDFYKLYTDQERGSWDYTESILKIKRIV